jgi:hypothetical protein
MDFEDIIAYGIAGLIVGTAIILLTCLIFYVEYLYITASAKQLCKYTAEYNIKAAKEILKDNPNARIVL